MDITHLLEKSTKDHDHLCPRQILGVRIGLAGMKAVGFMQPPAKKQLLIIAETDGCFVDGVIAATNCTVGHRTLRIADYGKVAATFVNVNNGRTVRVAPRVDIRDRASAFVPKESQHYLAQLYAYQTMLDDQMLTLQDVTLTTPIEQIVSRPGLRVNCVVCSEEIMNGREVVRDGFSFCETCVGKGYYEAAFKYGRANNSTEFLFIPEQDVP